MIATDNCSIIRFRGEDTARSRWSAIRTSFSWASYILPQHQRKGLGTLLVQELASEARSSRKPLRCAFSSPTRRVACTRD